MSAISSDVGVFGIVPRWATDALRGESVAVHVLAILAAHADRRTDAGWTMSRAALAAEVGVSVSTVQRAVGKLQAVGAVEVEARYTDEGRQWNRYVVRFSDPGRVMAEPTRPGHQRPDPGSPMTQVPRARSESPRETPKGRAARQLPANRRQWQVLVALEREDLIPELTTGERAGMANVLGHMSPDCTDDYVRAFVLQYAGHTSTPGELRRALCERLNISPDDLLSRCSA